MDKKKRMKIIRWIVVIIWMVVIYNLSSQVADESNKLSTGVTQVIVETVEKVVPSVTFDVNKFNHIVRKNAHFFAYLLLGLLVMAVIKKRDAKSIILVLSICILYAISDELHQFFVPGRGPAVKDVLIDSAGSIIGMILYLGVMKIKKKSKKKKSFQYY